MMPFDDVDVFKIKRFLHISSHLTQRQSLILFSANRRTCSHIFANTSRIPLTPPPSPPETPCNYSLIWHALNNNFPMPVCVCVCVAKLKDVAFGARGFPASTFQSNYETNTTRLVPNTRNPPSVGTGR